MKEKDETKEQLINELAKMRKRITELKTAEVSSKLGKQLLIEVDRQMQETAQKLFMTKQDLEIKNKLLKEARIYAQSLVDTVQTPMLVINTSLQVKSANRAFYQTFRVSKEETENQLLPQIGSGQWNIPDLLALINENISKDTPFESFEIGHEFPGVGYMIMLISMCRISQEALGFTTDRILFVIEDITERRQAEERIKQYTKELEAMNEELDSFTYTASHDLKEPLRGIETFSQFLLEDYQDKLDDRGKDYLNRISDSVIRMKNLIEDLLALSRISRIKNPYTLVDSGELVEDVIQRLKFVIEEKNVKIEIDDELPFLLCDEVKMKEVFYNLTSNAIKYNDKPGPVIEIGTRKETVRGSSDSPIPPLADSICFFVRDNGIGIKKEHFDLIFQIFRRLHGHKDYGGGTGAGLAIVKKIIDEHQGKIWVESQEGKGTTFFFAIPKKCDSPKVLG